MDADNKLHNKHRKKIKLVVILFEVEINMVIFTMNELYGSYNYFINIKI